MLRLKVGNVVAGHEGVRLEVSHGVPIVVAGMGLEDQAEKALQEGASCH